ncbi:MAG: glutathione peroxidase [Halobacteriovorax sp.]|nr:glutathione peroxidase [Halobacteriovorax sp.]|tara:strand:- start:737 stop:1255 length:519 start_codon:yes stop_codon:yes gene_type:complete
MKYFLTLLLLSFNLHANSFFDGIELKSARGKDLKISKGPVLVVNIATRCGYTPQLDELEKLSQTYAKKGLTVIGIPSNDFGGQTPESDEDVAKFCKLNYGVSFPITKKTIVSGSEKVELYKKLIKSSKETQDIQWNFEKFLISSDGSVVQRFSSTIKPESKEIKAAIDKLLP